MNRATLEQAVISWFVAALPAGGRVVTGWPNAPRPTLPYLTARISSVRPYGHDDQGPMDDAGVQKLAGDRVVTVSTQAFGTGALDMLSALVNSIARTSIQILHIRSGIAPRKPERVQDLTRFLETSAEERGAVDFEVGIKETYTDPVGWFEHVSGEATIFNAGQEHEAIGSGAIGDVHAGGPSGFTIAFSADLT